MAVANTTISRPTKYLYISMIVLLTFIMWCIVIYSFTDCNSTTLNDFLINQNMKDIPLRRGKSTPLQKLGKAEMAKSSVTIIGVARNIEDRLDSFLDQVQYLAAQFNSSQIVFVEGDSTDKSATVLSNWATKEKDSRFVYSITSTKVRENIGKFEGSLLPREGRITIARNKALSEARKLKKTDYLINIDMDILGWEKEGIEDSFGRKDSWDVVCAHGILLHGIYRDTYALRVLGLNINHHMAGADHNLYNITSKQQALNRIAYKVRFS